MDNVHARLAVEAFRQATLAEAKLDLMNAALNRAVRNIPDDQMDHYVSATNDIASCLAACVVYIEDQQSRGRNLSEATVRLYLADASRCGGRWRMLAQTA